MAASDVAKVDIQESITKSLKEVELIRINKLPKRSYKDMIKKVRDQVNEEK